MIIPYQNITQKASFIFLYYKYFQIDTFLDFLRFHQIWLSDYFFDFRWYSFAIFLSLFQLITYNFVINL
jgi:hypothetical protein